MMEFAPKPAVQADFRKKCGDCDLERAILRASCSGSQNDGHR